MPDVLNMMHPRLRGYGPRDPKMDAILARQAEQGGLAITADGRVYEGGLYDGQDMTVFDGRDPIARVAPDHLRKYAAAQEEIGRIRKAIDDPSPAGHWAYTDKATGERRMARLRVTNHYNRARKEFAEWVTPSKMGQVRGALVGAIPRNEISTLQDIQTYGEWLGRDMQDFFLHNVVHTFNSNRHVIRVADRLPNQHVSTNLRPYEMPRDTFVRPRRIQLEALRDAVRMHVGYSEQVETDFDIDAAQRGDALMDFDRALEEKIALELSQIDVETDDITGITDISGTDGGGFHSDVKLSHEFRRNRTEFEKLHRNKVTDVSGSPSTIDAIFQNTWMHLAGSKLHPAGLPTGGGRTRFGLFGDIHINSSVFIPDGVLYWTCKPFAVAVLQAGQTTHKIYNALREVSETIMNTYNRVECTTRQLDWKGSDGRAYGYKTMVTE